MSNPIFIVNLSSLFAKSLNYSRAFKKFAALSQRYSASYAPGFFRSATDMAWVLTQYNKLKPVINDYKLGKLTSSQFLDELQKIFNFLATTKFPTEEQERLWYARHRLLSLANLRGPDIDRTQLTPNLMARALLEEAWNGILELDHAMLDRFNHLVSLAKAKNGKIILISNTNELNVNAMFAYLKLYCPTAQWHENVDLSNQPSATPNASTITIADNIELELSYKSSSYKADSDRQTLAATPALPGTPAMMTTLIKRLRAESFATDDIQVISQWDKDLKQAAKSLNLAATSPNLQSAQAFYQPASRLRMRPPMAY